LGGVGDDPNGPLLSREVERGKDGPRLLEGR